MSWLWFVEPRNQTFVEKPQVGILIPLKFRFSLLFHQNYLQ